jgi:hypothetical protein
MPNFFGLLSYFIYVWPSIHLSTNLWPNNIQSILVYAEGVQVMSGQSKGMG